MESLLHSFKDARGQSTIAHYLVLAVSALFLAGFLVIGFLYIKVGSLQAIQQALPNIPFQSILYVIAGLVVAMILLMLFNSQYEVYFQARPSSTITRKVVPPKIFWTPASVENPQDPTGLSVLSADFPMTRPDTYSMGIELYVGASRSNDKLGPYRHILHRGSADLSLFKPNSPGSAPKGRGDLNDGLPSQMNPGLFLDQYTNDLVVYIDTDPHDGDQANRESVRIPDLPLKKAFYVHLSVHDNILEIYINCRLAITKILNGAARGVPNDWYGRVGFARAAVIPQNLKLWDTDLSAMEIRNSCPPIATAAILAPSAGCSANCSK